MCLSLLTLYKYAYYCLNTIGVHVHACIFNCGTFLPTDNYEFMVKNWMQIIEGIPNATAVQLDVMDHESLFKYISRV